MAERLMKDSGVEWIGAIPEDWNIDNIGSLYKERKEKCSDTEYSPLSVTMQGIVPQLSTAAKTDAHDDRKLVRKGDFAINSRSDRRGSCGISPQDGSVSLINTVLTPKTEMNPGFYNWLFHSDMFSSEFYKWGHGIVDDLWTTNWQDMKAISVPVPSQDEQARIADFLDKKVSEIDAVITKTRESIEEYKKLKQSIITEAVTKGLDPNVEMKDSGNKFVGLIPKRWEIKRTRFIADSLEKGNGITKEEVYPDGDISCVRYGEIYTKYNGAFTKCVSRTKLEQIAKPSSFSHGDLLFCGTGELVEEIGKNIVYLGNEKCLAGGDIIVMKHRQDPTFINYALNSGYSQTQKSYGKAKLKVVHISTSEIGNVWIALPPMEEQKKIGEYLDGQCSKYDDLISKKEQVITELEQYKKSIIYEYVTGKKEVA